MTCVIPSEIVVTVPSTVSPTFVTMELISGASALIVSISPLTESVTLAIPVQARSTPAPIASRATPKTPIPTAPAVSAGPVAAATPMRAPMPTAIPARVAIAGPPASEISIAESTRTPIACAAMYKAAAPAIICSAPPAIVEKDPPAASTGAAAVPAADVSPPRVPVRLPIPPVMDEIPPITFPPITSKGPATAAIPATLMIVSCISGERPFQASLSAETPSASPPAMSTSIGPADSTRSAPTSFSSFSVVVNWSIGSCVSSNVVLTDPPKSSTELDSSSNDSLPSWTAAAIAGPAFAPKSSMAACAASVSLPAPDICSCRSASASVIDTPSLVAFWRAFLRPVMTVELSTPLFSRFARNPVAELMLKPISWSAVPFVSSDDASLSSGTPVSCPALLSMSKTSPASSASRPNAAIAACTVSMEFDTSVPFRSANFINCADRSSRACPVTPKRVLTSPIAAPAVEKSVGMVVVRFFRIWLMLSSASPDAPVFWTIVSRPSSTDFQEATAAVPTATSGPVSPLVRADPAPDIFLPMASDMDVPAACPAAAPAGCAASVRSFVIVCCAPFITGVMVMVACATSGIFLSSFPQTML